MRVGGTKEGPKGYSLEASTHRGKGEEEACEGNLLYVDAVTVCFYHWFLRFRGLGPRSFGKHAYVRVEKNAGYSGEQIL